MTKPFRKLLASTGNFLRRMLAKPAWDFNCYVADPRHQRGRQWQFKTLMQTLLWGLLTNRRSLRAVETMTEIGSEARVPDSTLYDLVGKFGVAEVEGLRHQLHAQVKADWRSKCLEPVGLPCGVAAIDNKTLWSGSPAESKDPAAQVAHPQDRPAYAQLRAVRTVLISAASKPAIDQVIIPAQTNEQGVFADVLEVLETNYPTLIEVYTMDAGFCSQANAAHVAQAQKGYIFGLKGNQPELLREAARLLGSETRADRSTQWERYQGAVVRYHLYRTREIAGYLDGSHLQQVWRIEKEIRCGQRGEIVRENRYYLTNLHWGRFHPEQILRVVRFHWGIENNCYWTMDVIWDEDTKVWCGQGLGIRVLGLLRLMAYNLTALLRCRYLRRREERGTEKRRWQEFSDLIFLVLAGRAIEAQISGSAEVGLTGR